MNNDRCGAQWGDAGGPGNLSGLAVGLQTPLRATRRNCNPALNPKQCDALAPAALPDRRNTHEATLR